MELKGIIVIFAPLNRVVYTKTSIFQMGPNILNVVCQMLVRKCILTDDNFLISQMDVIQGDFFGLCTAFQVFKYIKVRAARA